MPVTHGRSHIFAPPHVAGATPQHWHLSLLHPRTRKEMALAAGFSLALAGIVAGAYFAYSRMDTDLFASAREGARLTVSQKPVGRILVPMTDGTLCREHRFDNDTGRMGSYRLVRCDDVPTGDVQPSFASGFRSFKEAFGKR